MSLNAKQLADLLDEKASLYLEGYDTGGRKMRATLFRVIAEAVVEHIKEKGRVVVVVDDATDTGSGSIE